VEWPRASERIEEEIDRAARRLFERSPADVAALVHPQPAKVARIGGRKPPRWYADTLDALHRLAGLSDGWNGYGAPPVHAGSVTATLSFLSHAALPDAPAPAIVPLGDGGVQLEWRSGALELDVGINPDGTYDAVYEGPDGEEEWVGDAYSGVAIGLVRRLAAVCFQAE
jgi:hypothetical protein